MATIISDSSTGWDFFFPLLFKCSVLVKSFWRLGSPTNFKPETVVQHSSGTFLGQSSPPETATRAVVVFPFLQTVSSRSHGEVRLTLMESVHDVTHTISCFQDPTLNSTILMLYFWTVAILCFSMSDLFISVVTWNVIGCSRKLTHQTNSRARPNPDTDFMSSGASADYNK